MKPRLTLLSVLVLLFVFSFTLRAQANTNVIEYSVPGDYLFTPPAGATDINIVIVGAGGGGGGNYPDNTVFCSLHQGAGGGGGQGKRSFRALIIGQTYIVRIPLGGRGGLGHNEIIGGMRVPVIGDGGDGLPTEIIPLGSTIPVISASGGLGGGGGGCLLPGEGGAGGTSPGGGIPGSSGDGIQGGTPGIPNPVDAGRGGNGASDDDEIVAGDDGTPGYVRITFDTPNETPDAVDDNASTTPSTLVTIDVLANDSDADADALSITLVSDPPNGTAEINDDTIDYLPDDGFTGIDSFTYTVSDGNGGTDTANVEVSVQPPPNRPPIAIDDSASVQAGSSVSIPVLANDADQDGNPLFVVGVGSSVGGTTINPDGTITYSAPAGPAFSDSFTYTLSDGYGGTDIGNVSVNVTAVPPPVICAPGDPNYNPEGDLSGTLSADGTSGIITNASSVCTYEVGIASYLMFDDVIDNQQLFNFNTILVNPGPIQVGPGPVQVNPGPINSQPGPISSQPGPIQSITIGVSLPLCAAQVDLFYGPVLTSLNGARYNDRLLAAVQIGTPNYCVIAP